MSKKQPDNKAEIESQNADGQNADNPGPDDQRADKDNATVFRPKSARQEKDNATVLKPVSRREKTDPGKPQESSSSPQPSPSPGMVENEAALTRIKNTFRSQDTSQGFARAIDDANKALAENKIILNNRFVLEETLGVGGMGTVYKAQDLRKVEASDLNTFVAVKVLNSEFQDHPDAFITLQRETSRSHILSHPNIVTVHDFDRDGNVIYMTMELLEGQGMDELLRAHRGAGVPLEQALKIIREYCSALEFAHKKNIIHSDLKPGNIYITKDSAKVLDFGIARMTAEAQQANDFDAGTLNALTPAYATLEMIQSQPATPSDDVYAAAVIAYELFAGVHPYDRKPADQALAENLKPARLKQLSKRQWNALESALKLTQKERTASIKQFIDELTLVKKPPVFKIFSLLLAGALLWFAYVQFFTPDKLTNVIKQTLEKGNNCYNDKDYTCAIESAKAIIKISPSHPQAKALLHRAEEKRLAQQVSQLAGAAKKCLAGDGDLGCAKDNLKQLSALAPVSPQIRILEEAIKEKQQQIFIGTTMEAAQACFTRKDYECTLMRTAEVLEAAPEHRPAIALSEKTRMLVKKNQQAVAANKRKYTAHLGKGEKCFGREDYPCAMKQAKLALQYRPGDARAESLEQKAQYAQLQKNNDIAKADNMLKKAKKCLQDKNYSCTIAKSESALELIPGYAPALKLKNKASKAIADLKNSLTIE